jgi:tetratricopeptide (TPR) repeat protein
MIEPATIDMNNTELFELDTSNEYELRSDEDTDDSSVHYNEGSQTTPLEENLASSKISIIQTFSNWALSSIERHEEKSDFDRGQCYEEMGIAKAQCGNTKEALCLFELALQAKREESSNDDDTAQISTLLNRARAFGRMDLIRSCSEYKEIIQITEKARSLPCISTTKNEDLFLAKILLELAHVQCKRGDFVNGMKNFNSALDIRVGHLGTKHVDVAFVWFMMGKTYHIKRDYKEAMVAYRNSLKILGAEGHKKNHALINIIQRLVSDRTMLADISKEHWGDNTI